MPLNTIINIREGETEGQGALSPRSNLKGSLSNFILSPTHIDKLGDDNHSKKKKKAKRELAYTSS